MSQPPHEPVQVSPLAPTPLRRNVVEHASKLSEADLATLVRATTFGTFRFHSYAVLLPALAWTVYFAGAVLGWLPSSHAVMLGGPAAIVVAAIANLIAAERRFRAECAELGLTPCARREFRRALDRALRRQGLGGLSKEESAARLAQAIAVDVAMVD